MKKGRKCLFTSLLLCSLVLSACGGGGGAKQSSSTTKEKQASSDKVLHLMESYELGSMDSLHSQDEGGFVAQSQVFEGLYQLDEKDQVIPALATDMPEVSEDGKTYTIKMRKDSKWTNGTKVTARDFIFAWQQLADPTVAANYGFLMEGTVLNGTEVLNGEKPVSELGVKAIDDYTIEVQLAQPVPYFASLLAFNPFYPQNEAYVKEQGDAYATTSENMIYNGPFVMTKWDSSSLNWTLKKNKDYYDSKSVKSDELSFQVIKEPGTALNLYNSDELDIANLSGIYASEKKDDPDYVVTPNAYIGYFKMNQVRKEKPSIFANENVRKAVAYAIDKEGLVTDVLANGSMAAGGFVPKDFVVNPETGEDFRKEAGDYLKMDLKKANSYWEKAQKEIGTSISLELLTSDDEADKKVAEFVQGQLQEALPGLKLTIKSVPKQNSIQLTKDSDYELCIGSWGPDYQDPMTFLANLKTGGNSNYSNPDFDAMLEAASTTLANEPEKRWETLIAAEKLLVEEDAGVVPIYQRASTTLQKPNVKGIVHHNFGSPYSFKGAYKE